MIRRAVDIVFGFLALTVLSPIFAVIGVSVLLSSGRPIFYAGERVGRGGRVFRMWKFRTMVANADRSGSVSGPNDLRVTGIGRVLRRTKLDELPQFINLVRGDITLVGPRPEVPHVVAGYTESQTRILQFTPGITAPGELYFTKVQEPSIPEGVDAEEYFIQELLDPKIQIDVVYFSTRSFTSDCRIIWETLRLMVSRV